MKKGTKVMTPDGPGETIGMIGAPPKGKPYLVRLKKRIGIYDQFYYSKEELKEIK